MKPKIWCFSAPSFTFLLFIASVSVPYLQAESNGEPAVILRAPTILQKLAVLPPGNFNEWRPTTSAYLKHQVEWAKLHEADGDALLAQGDVQGAFASYQKAMGEVGAGGYAIGWTLSDEISGGRKVLEIVPGGRAARAGAQVGDLLVSLDGIPLDGITGAVLDIWFYYLDGIPLRPQVFSIRRGTQTLELRIDRHPTLKSLVSWDWNERDYRDALEMKIIRFMVANKIEPQVNENMITAAMDLQRALKDATGAEDIAWAAEDLRAGTYASPGWADQYFNVAVLLEAAGNAVEADKCFRIFLMLRPDDPQDTDILKHLSSLAPLVRDEMNCRAWDGFWYSTRNGVKTDQGIYFERTGKIIKVVNSSNEEWLTGNILDEFHASALMILTAKGLNGGSLATLIDRWFGGRLEAASQITLSPDKKTLTLTAENDIDIDPANGNIIRQNRSTKTYVR